MRELAERMLKRSHKSWLGTKPLFELHRAVTAADLKHVEQTVRAELPEDMSAWLLLVGFGDINEDLSFRLEWFKSVEQGSLKGAVLFAQDILGNFYAYVPGNGSIVFFSRSAPKYAVLAASFRAFLDELEQRDYKLLQWVESLVGLPYQWDA